MGQMLVRVVISLNTQTYLFPPASIALLYGWILHFPQLTSVASVIQSCLPGYAAFTSYHVSGRDGKASDVYDLFTSHLTTFILRGTELDISEYSEMSEFLSHNYNLVLT